MAASERFASPSATHYWDGERHIARHMGRALGIAPGESVPDADIGLAWDVYLAYGRGAKLLEQPDFWMHQLDVKHAPRFDGAQWGRQVIALLPSKA